MYSATSMFAKAVVFGSLSGAAPYLLFTVPVGLSFMATRGVQESITMVFVPLLITLPFVLVASVIAGLPLTAVVSGSRYDCQRIYAISGLVLGALIPTIAIVSAGGVEGLAALPFFTIPGMIAGMVTGTVWGGWREALAAEAASNLAED